MTSPQTTDSLVAILAACALSGCGSSSGSAPDSSETGSTGAEDANVASSGTVGEEDWRRICDGSDAIRMVVRSEGPNLCQNSCLLSDLGSQYLYVRGDCTYWANIWSSEFPWSDTRRGTLDLQQEEELSRALNYDAWPSLGGVYLTPGDGGFPGGRIYSDGVTTIACAYGCQEGTVGPDILVERSRDVNMRMRDLWDRGSPLVETAPARVDVLMSEGVDPPLDDPEQCAAPWPFSIEPSAWTRADPTDATSSTLVTDPELNRQLRETRALYRDGPAPWAEGCGPLDPRFGLNFYELQEPATAYISPQEALDVLERDRTASLGPRVRAEKVVPGDMGSEAHECAVPLPHRGQGALCREAAPPGFDFAPASGSLLSLDLGG